MTDKQKASNESPLCWVRPVTTVPDLGGFQVCREGEGFPVWAHPNWGYAPVSAEPVAWMTHHDEPMLFPTEEEARSYCDDDEQPIPLYAAPVAAQAQPTFDDLQALAIKHGAWVPGYGPFAAEILATYGVAPEKQPHWVMGWLNAMNAVNAKAVQQPVSGADGLDEDVEFSGWLNATCSYDDLNKPEIELARDAWQARAALAQISGNTGQLDQFRDAAQMIEPSGNSGELPIVSPTEDAAVSLKFEQFIMSGWYLNGGGRAWDQIDYFHSAVLYILRRVEAIKNITRDTSQIDTTSTNHVAGPRKEAVPTSQDVPKDGGAERMLQAITSWLNLRKTIRESGRPPHTDFWHRSIFDAEDELLAAANAARATIGAARKEQA